MSMVPAADEFLAINRLQTLFPVRGGLTSRVVGHVHAVNDVSFALRRGEIFGLVGESGSGKTTVGRSILRLNEPSGGEIVFEGTDLLRLSRQQFRAFRRKIQIIFQDPYASLDPRKTVAAIIGEAIDIHRLARGEAKRARIAELLEWVGLPPDAVSRYPHEFSGGQRQRIGIARALAVGPSLLVADEPISALDVSIQAQVINLLQDLKEKLGLTILFIAHDLSVVEHICDRVGVMYLGKLMEVAPTKSLFAAPRHPYTRALMDAAPTLDVSGTHQPQLLDGEIPSAIDPPSGCVFRTRCPHAIEACAQIVPPHVEVSPGHGVACIRTELFTGEAAA
jgi:oligopeptide/dipeptide ABC transporter ATP-binding protein